jgi:hypothetical protein
MNREPYNPMLSDFPPFFSEGQREWQEVDSIRWGDADAVTTVAVVGAPLVANSKQLVATHTPRPIAWLLQLNCHGEDVPAGEVAAINVDFLITYGAGQSQDTLTVRVVLTAANGYQIPPGTLAPQIFIPAGDLQVKASVSYLPTVAGPVVIGASCMAAPWTPTPSHGKGR